MSGANITEVRLLNVPLESDYKHTLYFESKSAQETYFKSKTYKTLTDFTYQRKDGYIRVPIHIDTLLANCNYVMYKNSAYSSKWFYAFISDMEYKNDGTTWVHISTDVMQTYMFDTTIRPSFVEREHVTDDTIGLHTVPEQLETGEYVGNGSEIYEPTGYEDNMELRCGVVMASTVALTSKLVEGADDPCAPIVGGHYGNVFSGLKYYLFSEYEDPDTGAIGGIDALNFVIQRLAEKGQSDAIVSLFIVPLDFVSVGNTIVIQGNDTIAIAIRPVKGSFEAITKTWNFDKPTKLVNYTPVNNKLYTYPYSYLMMSNHNGGDVIYHYELFNTMSLCTFRINGVVTPGCSIRLFPTNYKNEFINYEEGLTHGKFPICNWTTDVYTNWLTQNAVNIGLSVATSGLQIAGGVASALATGGVGAVIGGGSVVGGITGILSTVGEVYQHSLIPPHAEGNVNSGDVCYSSGNLTFKAYHKCIRPEYAKIIDGYFTMFGYKVNEIKVPNKNHRANFWFTKTVDVNIDGAIPNVDMQKIKDCYNNGITFWRYPANIGDYSVDNSIV